MRGIALLLIVVGCSSPSPSSCDSCTTELARLEAEVRDPNKNLAVGVTIRATNLATNQLLMTAREVGNGLYVMIDDGELDALVIGEQVIHVTFDGGPYYAARDYTVSTDECRCHVMPAGVYPVQLGLRY